MSPTSRIKYCPACCAELYPSMHKTEWCKHCGRVYSDKDRAVLRGPHGALFRKVLKDEWNTKTQRLVTEQEVAKDTRCLRHVYPELFEK